MHTDFILIVKYLFIVRQEDSIFKTLKEIQMTH